MKNNIKKSVAKLLNNHEDLFMKFRKAYDDTLHKVLKVITYILIVITIIYILITKIILASKCAGYINFHKMFLT